MSDQSTPLPSPPPERLKLWLISQDKNRPDIGENTVVRAAIVVAATRDEARNIVPLPSRPPPVEWSDIARLFQSSKFADEIFDRYNTWRKNRDENYVNDFWAPPEFVTARLLGDALPGMTRGPIMAATNEDWNFYGT